MNKIGKKSSVKKTKGGVKGKEVEMEIREAMSTKTTTTAGMRKNSNKNVLPAATQVKVEENESMQQEQQHAEDEEMEDMEMMMEEFDGGDEQQQQLEQTQPKQQPMKQPIDFSTMDKKQIRLIKNRQSADLSRKRKRMQFAEMEKRVGILEMEKLNWDENLQKIQREQAFLLLKSAEVERERNIFRNALIANGITLPEANPNGATTNNIGVSLNSPVSLTTTSSPKETGDASSLSPLLLSSLDHHPSFADPFLPGNLPNGQVGLNLQQQQLLFDPLTAAFAMGGGGGLMPNGGDFNDQLLMLSNLNNAFISPAITPPPFQQQQAPFFSPFPFNMSPFTNEQLQKQQQQPFFTMPSPMLTNTCPSPPKSRSSSAENRREVVDSHTTNSSGDGAEEDMGSRMLRDFGVFEGNSFLGGDSPSLKNEEDPLLFVNPLMPSTTSTNVVQLQSPGLASIFTMVLFSFAAFLLPSALHQTSGVPSSIPPSISPSVYSGVSVTAIYPELVNRDGKASPSNSLDTFRIDAASLALAKGGDSWHSDISPSIVTPISLESRKFQQSLASLARISPPNAIMGLEGIFAKDRSGGMDVDVAVIPPNFITVAPQNAAASSIVESCINQASLMLNPNIKIVPYVSPDGGKEGSEDDEIPKLSLFASVPSSSGLGVAGDAGILRLDLSVFSATWLQADES